jgi:hypothetical protein
MLKAARELFLNPWFQIGFSTFCVAAAELFLKRGAVEAPALPASLNWTGVSGLASPLVWVGVVLVAVSFVSWLYVLRLIPLSVAFPISQFVHVLVPLGSWVFLGEFILLVAKPVARIEEKL